MIGKGLNHIQGYKDTRIQGYKDDTTRIKCTEQMKQEQFKPKINDQERFKPPNR